MYDQGYQTGRDSNLLGTPLQVCRSLIHLQSKILDHSQKATYNLCFMQESIENVKRLHIFCSSKFSFKYVHLIDYFFTEIRLVRRHYDLRDENLRCEAVFLSTVTPFASVPLLYF
jgi:hypothetical protein